jgi:hypothetical protein
LSLPESNTAAPASPPLLSPSKPLSSTVPWTQVLAYLLAAIGAAFGAGATTGAVHANGTNAAAVDSLVRARVIERLDVLESEVLVSGCVAKAQIQGKPLDGCAYLLENGYPRRPP